MCQAILSIAGVNYTLSSQHPIDYGDLGHSYDGFRDVPSTWPEAINIAIQIEVGSEPPSGPMTEFFNSGSAWVMLRSAEKYLITLDARATHGERLWTAAVAPDLSKATIFCREQMLRKTKQGIALSSPLAYPLDQVLLMHLLARHGGLIVHALGLRIGGKALILPGRSGAGKSTLARLLAQRPGLELLSDDRIVVRKVNANFLAYGTPWAGDQGAALNDKAPLHAICFLRHAHADHVEPLTPSQALERLLPVISVPWYDSRSTNLLLAFVDELLATVPTFELHFRPTSAVVELVERLFQTPTEG